jgi:hypothetical protein
MITVPYQRAGFLKKLQSYLIKLDKGERIDMASCTCENWTLEDLSKALQNKHKDNNCQQHRSDYRRNRSVFIRIIFSLFVIHIIEPLDILYLI